VKQALEDAKTELALITGQRAAETRAKKSIANFKVAQGAGDRRQGDIARERMYEFLERLIKAALPVFAIFVVFHRAVSTAMANYTLGVSDQSIFPRLSSIKSSGNIGFDVTIVTTARTNEEAKIAFERNGNAVQ